MAGEEPMAASSELSACRGPAGLSFPCTSGVMVVETCPGQLASLGLANCATNDLPICETQTFTPQKTEPVDFADWDTEALVDQSSVF